jgi:Secretion system C-terminal sorting domain
LGTTNPSPYSQGPGYGKVAYNGYTAYTKAGLNNIEQVWIRFPDGTSKLETSFATNNVVEKLGNKGSLMFTNGATRYYVDSLNTPSPVNTSFGKVYFVNDQFYVAIGNSLYKYDLPAKFLPKIKSFSPASAGKGGTVTIKGIGFAGTTAVSFGGIAATSFTAVSDTVLTAVVGAGSSGQIAITTPDGTDFAPDFIFIPGPVIRSINPSIAIMGSSVTITGTNFTGATAVSFGGVAATSFTINSATSITATVGAGASGDVAVVGPISTGNFSGFKFLPVPVITTNGPTSFASGGSVTLSTASGTGYSYQWLKDGVNITGAIDSQYTVRDAGSYTVKVSYRVSLVSAPVIVDVIFKLPATNFKLTNHGATCRGSVDGVIVITAQQNLNYTATVTNNNNVIGTYPFTLSAIVPNLAAGSYNVCLTVAGKPDYQQCFTAVITQPKDLDLYSAVIPGTKQVVLSLSGGDSYNVSLNGATTTTTASQLTLTLAPGKNTILVSTDKECQGQIERMLLLSDDKIIFPNPFVNTLNVNLGTDMVKKTTVSIYDIFNNVIYVKTYSNQLGVLQLNLPGLKPGMYMLKVIADDKQSIYKAIKSNVN